MSHLPRPLNSALLVTRLLETKACYDEYALCSLSDSSKKYRANVYTLRNISVKDRKYRIRSLKRAAAKASFIGSLEAEGRKWLILEDIQEEKDEVNGKIRPLWRSRIEYEQNFPLLSSCKPPSSRSLGVVNRSRMFGTASRNTIDVAAQAETPKPQKIKTAKQAQRARDRQRRARQAKQAASEVRKECSSPASKELTEVERLILDEAKKEWEKFEKALAAVKKGQEEANRSIEKIREGLERNILKLPDALLMQQMEVVDRQKEIVSLVGGHNVTII